MRRRMGKNSSTPKDMQVRSRMPINKNLAVSIANGSDRRIMLSLLPPTLFRWDWILLDVDACSLCFVGVEDVEKRTRRILERR